MTERERILEEEISEALKALERKWKKEDTPAYPPLCPGGDISPGKYYRLYMGLDDEDDSDSGEE